MPLIINQKKQGLQQAKQMAKPTLLRAERNSLKQINVVEAIHSISFPAQEADKKSAEKHQAIFEEMEC